MSEMHFQSTGRCEIIGNHTDHQHGKVMACAVDMFMDAWVEKTDDDLIRLESEGFGMYTVDLSDTGIKESEKGKTEALIRGTAEALKSYGYQIGGFKGRMTSQVLPGSGLSSSAAFEILIGRIISGLYNGGTISAEEIAFAGQKAENLYFGKPCGLMDQMAVSLGGMVYIDFEDPERPYEEKLTFDLKAMGYSICIVNTGGSHADLTDEYAAIPYEMKLVAGLFHKNVLREVSKEDFEKLEEDLKYEDLKHEGLGHEDPKYKGWTCGERPILRARHFFDENDRAEEARKAVKQKDVAAFLKLLNESGISSRDLLQNVTPKGAAADTGLGAALALSETLLEGRGAVRVHGGGFAGTIMAVVPDELLEKYTAGMEEKFGKGACSIVNIVG